MKMAGLMIRTSRSRIPRLSNRSFFTRASRMGLESISCLWQADSLTRPFKGLVRPFSSLWRNVTVKPKKRDFQKPSFSITGASPSDSTAVDNRPSPSRDCTLPKTRSRKRPLENRVLKPSPFESHPSSSTVAAGYQRPQNRLAIRPCLKSRRISFPCFPKTRCRKPRFSKTPFRH